MSSRPPVGVKVEGDLACFTRPEMKVERVSYDVITPSAARGMLEAIFWKPEFQWRIREIHVLNPVRRTSFTRNEVKSAASVRTALGWAEDGQGGYVADADRTQRHTLALRDVAYAIYADVELVGRGKQYHPEKYRAQFERRVNRGRCFRRPYLGCREFSATFGPVPEDASPIDRTGPLGRMLFDIKYDTDASGRGEPIFFRPSLESGILRVPDALYDRVRSREAA